MNTPLKGAPVTAAECNADWIKVRREIIHREGYAMRAGANNTIELKSLTPFEQLAAWDPLRINQWVPIALPNEAIVFASAADRDAVLQQLIAPSLSSQPSALNFSSEP